MQLAVNIEDFAAGKTISIDQQKLIQKAFSKACQQLNISAEEQSNISISENDPQMLNPKSKHPLNIRNTYRQLCCLIIFDDLHAISGGNSEFIQHWLRTENNAFNALPIEHMHSTEGLNEVHTYVMAMRQKA